MSKNRLIKIREILLIDNDSLKRVEWRIDRITELLPAKDDLIRLVGQVISSKE